MHGYCVCERGVTRVKGESNFVWSLLSLPPGAFWELSPGLRASTAAFNPSRWSTAFFSDAPALQAFQAGCGSYVLHSLTEEF